MKSTEIYLHTIKYEYNDYHGTMSSAFDGKLTEGDIEHIEFCIREGIREGQICTNVEDDLTVHGYWYIDFGNNT